MKILLVRPAVPRHTIGLKHIMICEPLELEYVAAGLRGHEVQVLDLIVEQGLRLFGLLLPDQELRQIEAGEIEIRAQVRVTVAMR